MNWKQIFVHGLGSIVLGGLTGGALTGPPHDLAGWLKVLAGAAAVLAGNQAGLWAPVPVTPPAPPAGKV